MTAVGVAETARAGKPADALLAAGSPAAATSSAAVEDERTAARFAVLMREAGESHERARGDALPGAIGTGDVAPVAHVDGRENASPSAATGRWATGLDSAPVDLPADPRAAPSFGDGARSAAGSPFGELDAIDARGASDPTGRHVVPTRPARTDTDDRAASLVPAGTRGSALAANGAPDEMTASRDRSDAGSRSLARRGDSTFGAAVASANPAAASDVVTTASNAVVQPSDTDRSADQVGPATTASNTGAGAGPNGGSVARSDAARRSPVDSVSRLARSPVGGPVSRDGHREASPSDGRTNLPPTEGAVELGVARRPVATDATSTAAHEGRVRPIDLAAGDARRAPLPSGIAPMPHGAASSHSTVAPGPSIPEVPNAFAPPSTSAANGTVDSHGRQVGSPGATPAMRAIDARQPFDVAGAFATLQGAGQDAVPSGLPSAGTTSASAASTATITTPITPTALVANSPLALHATGAAEALADTLRMTLSQQRGAATLSLTPVELGELTVDMRSEGDRLTVSLHGTVPATRDLLDALAPRLRDQLLADGHAEVSIEVADGPPGDRTSRDERSASQDDGDRQRPAGSDARTAHERRDADRQITGRSVDRDVATSDTSAPPRAAHGEARFLIPGASRPLLDAWL